MIRKLLLICPSFNYHEGLKKSFQNLGYEVIYFKDRSSSNAMVRAMLRINKHFLPTIRRIQYRNILRAASTDETPQLFNILVGNMAFIGPRPLIDISNNSITVEKRKELGINKGR